MTKAKNSSTTEQSKKPNGAVKISKTKTYHRPYTEVIDIELEAPVLAGSNQSMGSGW